MVQRLVKYICSMLLLILATTMADGQGQTTEPLDAMPQAEAVYHIDSEQPAAGRAIDHLRNEQLALPVFLITVEAPGYHPHPSKPKCLNVLQRANRTSTPSLTTGRYAHPHALTHHHAIDYYIYTLEHILI